MLSSSCQFSSRQRELECHSSCQLMCSISISSLAPLSLLLIQISPKFTTSSLLLQDLDSRALLLSSTFPLLFVSWLVVPLDMAHWTQSHRLFRDDVALQAAAHQHQCKTGSQKTEPSCPNLLLKAKLSWKSSWVSSEFHHDTKGTALQEMQLRIGNTAPCHSVVTKHYGILPDSHEKK